jgi:hypothetical protein
LLVRAVREQSLVLGIVNHFVSKVSTCQLNNSLLRPSYFCKQFQFNHFQHLEHHQGFNVGNLLSEIADKWCLADEVPSLSKMMVPECTESTKNEIFHHFDGLFLLCNF